MFFVHYILFFRGRARKETAPEVKMDGELKNLKCNISQLAAITGLHRQTVVSRLSGVPLALGSNEKNKLYLLTDVIRVLMETPVSQAAEHQDPNKMTPKERKNWFDSEKGR